MAEPERLCLTSELSILMEMVSKPEMHLQMVSMVVPSSPVFLVSEIGTEIGMVSKIDLETVTT